MEFNPEMIQTLGQRGGVSLLIILVGIVLYLLSHRALRGLHQRELLPGPLFLILKNTMRWLVLLAVLVMVLQNLGIKVSTIITALLTIAGMIAIGFIAVWSVLSNILCSFLLLAFRNFNIGDEIEIIEPVGSKDGGLRGTVSGFNVIYTTLTEAAEEGELPFQTQVPNNIFFQKSLRRRPGKMRQGLWQHLLSQPELADQQRQKC